jgi:transposase
VPEVGLSSSGSNPLEEERMAHRHARAGGAPAITIGIDPHKASHTAAALGTGAQLLAQVRVPTTRAGYRQLRRWAARWPDRCWAVENAAGLGRTLAQWLLGDGERVVDVPPKLSARVRLLSTGHGRKTDQADAVSTALAARGPAELHSAAVEGHATTLRLLADRRDDLVARRTQVLNRLHALLAALVPGAVPAHLSADRAAGLLRHVRPSAGPRRTRRRLAGDLVREVRRLDADVKALEAQLAAAVEASQTTLVELFGIGPILAAKILGRGGDVRRFPSAARFASYCGVAPIEASSGDVVRHRLSRAGDRQLNFALHVMATCQARQHPAGRAYYLRKRAEGHSDQEALRCLKRRLADVLYRQLLRDARAAPPSAPSAAPAPRAKRGIAHPSAG